MKCDEQMTEFLSGVVGVVEANSFESLCLWEEYHQKGGKTWVQNNLGYLETVGHFARAPVCVSLHTAVVDGHKLLFMDPTSQVVDHRLIDAWLKKTMPKTAFREGTDYVNKTDAMNFHNVFPRAPQADTTEPGDA